MRKSLKGFILIACAVLCFGSVLAQDEPTTFIFGEYYECDQNREAFADILVEHVFGPVYQKYVDDGRLTGWGWMSHNAGGEWRRVLYYASDDLAKLLETRDEIIEQVFQAEMSEEGREFTGICPGHDDLIWASVAGPSAGQQLQERGPATYSTYYVCDVSKQERADEIVQQLMAPAINKLMESGQIKSWGWHAHVIGGQYRRLMTHNGMSHAALIEAVNTYNDAASQQNAALANEFSQICNSHVDYLWDQVLPKSDDEE